MLQAKAWMAWGMSVGFGLSNHLQRWNGQQWDLQGAQPAALPSPGKAAAAPATPAGHDSSAKASSSHGSKPLLDHMTASVAQAMLECHYSFHNAFLQEHPLLEVRFSPGC